MVILRYYDSTMVILRYYDSTMVKSRKYDTTMVKLRQHDGENTMLYRTIIIVLSYYRVFTIVVSHYRHRVFTSWFHYFALSSSYYRVSRFKLTHSKAMALTVFCTYLNCCRVSVENSIARLKSYRTAHKCCFETPYIFSKPHCEYIEYTNSDCEPLIYFHNYLVYRCFEKTPE